MCFGGACLQRNWCRVSDDGLDFGKPSPNGKSVVEVDDGCGMTEGVAGCVGTISTLGGGAIMGTLGGGTMVVTSGTVGRTFGMVVGALDGGSGSTVTKIEASSKSALQALSPASRPKRALVGGCWSKVTMSPTAWRRKSFKSTSGTGMTCGTKVTVS